MNADSTELSGALLVNKPQGITSFDVVGKIRKMFHTRRVGHTGTLDPLATGVLVILIGSAVKASELMTAERKKYEATLKLGLTSDTEDITGILKETNTPIPPKDAVLAAVRSFEGKSEQIPPMYSAIKIHGKKLVDIARNGGTVERPSREITIYSIHADGDGDTYRMEVDCSKGTYIRTLCADIGKKLGCGAVMSSLNRLSVGSFTLDNSYTLEQLDQMSEKERKDALIDREHLTEQLESIRLNDFFTRLCINGCEIYQKKIGTDFPVGTYLNVYGTDGYLGIGIVSEYENGAAVKLQVRL